MVKAIILDVGGVLVQTLHTDRRNLWEKRFNLPPGQLANEIYSETAGLATIGHLSSNQIWDSVKQKFSLTEDELHQLKIDFFAGDELNTELYSYVQRLRSDYKTIILSNAWDNARKVYTNRYQLDRIVDEMIISAEEGVRKPDEKIFMLALKHCDAIAQETLYVDDTLVNITEGRELGFNTVLFTDTRKAIQEIEGYLEE